MGAIVRKAIEQLIPPGSICGGCKSAILDPAQWRLSLFGDVICKRCRDNERAANPDLYADAEIRARSAHAVSEAILSNRKPTVRASRASLVAADKSAVLVSSAQCPLCTETIYPHSAQWDFIEQRHLCRDCFHGLYAANYVNGEWREDKRHRVFQVVHIETHLGDILSAVYPYGFQRIPQWSARTPHACQTLFELQHAEMMDLVEKYFNDYLTIVEKYSRNIDYDVAYDAAMFAYMRCCTLYDPAKQFVPYITTAIIRAINRERSRQRKHRHIDIDEISHTLIADDGTYQQRALEQHAANVEALISCRLIAADNWDIFLEWVLGNRTQEQIGRELGVISQTVSMRFSKIRQQCKRANPHILPNKQKRLR